MADYDKDGKNIQVEGEREYLNLYLISDKITMSKRIVLHIETVIHFQISAVQSVLLLL